MTIKSYLLWMSIWLLCTMFLMGNTASSDIIGIDFDSRNARLLSFDPYTGTLSRDHGLIHTRESFIGMTYDSARNRLLVLANGLPDIYAINTTTLDVTYVGEIPNPFGGFTTFTVESITYDAATDTLYANANIYDRLARDPVRESYVVTFDPTDVSVLTTQATNAQFFSRGVFNPADNLIYGANYLAPVPVRGPFDQPEFASLDPLTGAVTSLFQPPINLWRGFAALPDGQTFIGQSDSLANAAGISYWELDIATSSVTELAGFTDIGAFMVTMIDFDFTLAEGQLNTFDPGPLPPSIPLPAAIWLFGTGLLVLIGVTMR